MVHAIDTILGLGAAAGEETSSMPSKATCLPGNPDGTLRPVLVPQAVMTGRPGYG